MVAQRQMVLEQAAVRHAAGEQSDPCGRLSGKGRGATLKLLGAQHAVGGSLAETASLSFPRAQGLGVVGRSLRHPCSVRREVVAKATGSILNVYPVATANVRLATSRAPVPAIGRPDDGSRLPAWAPFRQGRLAPALAIGIIGKHAVHGFIVLPGHRQPIAAYRQIIRDSVEDGGRRPAGNVG